MNWSERMVCAEHDIAVWPKRDYKATLRRRRAMPNVGFAGKLGNFARQARRWRGTETLKPATKRTLLHLPTLQAPRSLIRVDLIYYMLRPLLVRTVIRRASTEKALLKNPMLVTGISIMNSALPSCK